jgi:predicted nuclease of predicted toxin-antitoxin system
MKIKLGHNLSRHLRDKLKNFGHDVDTAFDEGLARTTDRELLREASKQGRILFTLDADFLNLKVYPPKLHTGVVVFRPTRQGALAISKMVEAFVRSSDLTKCSKRTTLVERTRIRSFR